MVQDEILKRQMTESSTASTELLPLQKKARRCAKGRRVYRYLHRHGYLLGSCLAEAEGNHASAVFADLVPRVLLAKRV